jgi:hypothetical protein
LTLEDLMGWVTVMLALGVYMAAWLFCVAYVLGLMVTGWGPHDHLHLREALVPVWCLLSRDEAVMDRLRELLDARREAAGELPYEPRHAAPPDEKRLLDDVEAHYWLYLRHWPPYL